MFINLVIGGRLQGEGTLNGSMELSELLIEAMADAGYSGKQVRTYFYPWYANFQEVADRLHLLRTRYKLERRQFGINCYAFSRGVGYGVKRLAGWLPWWNWRRLVWMKSGLARHGLSIDTGVYCDGIYHHSWSVAGFQWRSVVGSYQIKLPSTAGKYIYAFRQEISRPMGMELIVEPPSCLVGGKATVLEYEHIYMDDAAEYHQKCVEVALETAKRYVPSSKKEEMPKPISLTPAPSPSEALESKLTNEVETTQEAVTGVKEEP